MINDLNERTLVYKFANYIKANLPEIYRDYCVDCEYNRSYSDGKNTGTKQVVSKNGNSIDIVVTKRNNNPDDDLLCFEIKKENNNKDKEMDKDRDKLRVLTGIMPPTDFKTRETISNMRFNYKFGIFLVITTEKNDIKLEIYKRECKNPSVFTYSNF